MFCYPYKNLNFFYVIINILNKQQKGITPTNHISASFSQIKEPKNKERKSSGPKEAWIPFPVMVLIASDTRQFNIFKLQFSHKHGLYFLKYICNMFFKTSPASLIQKVQMSYHIAFSMRHFLPVLFKNHYHITNTISPLDDPNY